MSNEERENPARTRDYPAGTPSYQQTQTASQTPRVPGSYAGPYPSAGSYASSESARNGEDRKLIVGEGITMSGEIETSDTLVVEGTVEASLKGASILDITESGVFYGTVEIENATIAGRFEGDLTVKGRLTVRASGSVTGTIVFGELAVEAGATVDGKISPLATGKAQQQGSRPAREAIPAAPHKNDNQGDHGELPFAGNRATAAE